MIIFFVYCIFSEKNYGQRRARKTIIILSCIVFICAVLLAVVFGTFAGRFHRDGLAVNETIYVINENINELLRLLRPVNAKLDDIKEKLNSTCRFSFDNGQLVFIPNKE